VTAPKVTEYARERRAFARSLWIGGVVVLAIVVGGGITLVREPPLRIAGTRLLVEPAPDLPDEEMARYYEMRDRGEIVATFAQLIRDRELDEAAIDALGGPSATGDVEVDVEVVLATSVLRVAAEARSSRVAVAIANDVASRSADYLNGLDLPFRVRITGEANRAREAGASTTARLIVLLLVALIVGVCVVQVVFRVAMLTVRHQMLGRELGASTPEAAAQP
jgi:capsular polysaccharide biosynthesis protein